MAECLEQVCFLDRSKAIGDKDVECVICCENVLTTETAIGLFHCDCTVVVHDVCLHNYCAKVATITCPVCREKCAAFSCVRTAKKTLGIKKELVPSGDVVVFTEDVPDERVNHLEVETTTALERSSAEGGISESGGSNDSSDSDEEYLSGSSSSGSEDSQSSSWSSRESVLSSTNDRVLKKRKRSNVEIM